MPLRPQGLKLERAIEGFMQYKTAEALSPLTLTGYRHTLKEWLAHAGNVDVTDLAAEHVRDFLAFLRTDYKPRRVTGKTGPLSPKTIRNAWITLASFFRWLNREFDLPNPMANVPPPRFPKNRRWALQARGHRGLAQSGR